MIDEKNLIDEIENFSMTITGMRSGKGQLADFMREYKKSVLRIIDEQPKTDEWLPIEDRPKKPCLMLFKNGEMIVGYYEDNGDLAVQTSSEYFTYIEEEPIAWMPLPEPYKED